MLRQEYTHAHTHAIGIGNPDQDIVNTFVMA